ncbi:hypothetical protein CDOMC_0064 [Campylobacter sp. RM16192]|nr:hypothetical protein CDOMC_0064 [Campylobacter sp. RM16192]
MPEMKIGRKKYVTAAHNRFLQGSKQSRMHIYYIYATKSFNFYNINLCGSFYLCVDIKAGLILHLPILSIA